MNLLAPAHPRSLSLAADHSSIRRANLSTVLGLLAEGPASRADIAATTGMTRGTVGTLVAELEQRGLVAIGDVRRGGAGRPGNLVRIRRDRVVALGLGMSDYFFNAVITDLSGNVIVTRRKITNSGFPPPLSAVGELSSLAHGVLSEVATPELTLSGIGVAIPGLVDTVNASIPGTAWVRFPLRAELEPRLPGSLTGAHIHNAASLGAMAEQRLGGHRVDHLVYLTGSGGMEAGYIIDGRPYRGSSGFAGEVGHMLIDPDGRLCRCGRRGCWEAEVGLDALFERIADQGDIIRDSMVDLDQRTVAVMQRARAGDERTLRGLTAVGRYLGIGIANLINAVDPQVVVGGGYIGRLGEWLIPLINEEVASRAIARDAIRCRVVGSALGADAAAIGAAIAALQPVLRDPGLVPAP